MRLHACRPHLVTLAAPAMGVILEALLDPERIPRGAFPALSLAVLLAHLASIKARAEARSWLAVSFLLVLVYVVIDPGLEVALWTSQGQTSGVLGTIGWTSLGSL